MKRQKKKRNNEHGQTIAESVMCMLLICLILFGLLQIFYLTVAQMLADYASFCATRSYSVGFADYLINRSARVASIGASGNLVYPEGEDYGGPLQQFAVEEVRIPEYITGERWLFYGIGDEENLEWDWNDVGISKRESMGTVGARVYYQNYPLNFPMRRAFTYDENVNIHGDAKVMNYAENYLGEQ